MTGIPPKLAAGLDRDGWERLLLNGADGVFLVEAAARLIARHDYWMHVPQFLNFVEFHPPEAAGIWYVRAVSALENNQLPTRNQEDANVLRIAASLVTAHRVILREVVENNSADTIRLIAEALMYADGFTTSTATPGA